MRTSTIVLFLLVAAVSGCGERERATDTLVDDRDEGTAPTIRSPAFEDGGEIPVEYTCDGDNVPPPLTVDGLPDDSVEVVLIVDDPDAPGGTFVHWLVAGLQARGLEAGDGVIGDPLPSGAIEGVNDMGGVGWAGPCPPEGDDPHGYRFTVIPLLEPSQLAPGFSAEELRAATGQTALSSATLTGRYGR